MWLQILIGIVFLIIISLQIIHWYIYFYTRFSPKMKDQRHRLKTLVKMSTKPLQIDIKNKSSKEDEDYVYRGYT